MKELFLTKNPNNELSLRILLFFFIIIFTFPRGIGFSVFGAVVDFVEILQLVIFLFILPKITIENINEKIFLIGIFFFPLLSVIFLYESFPTTILRLIFYFIFVFSGFFVGKFLLNKIYATKNFNFFFSIILIANSIGLLIALINYNFEFFRLDDYRTYESGVLENLAFKQRIITGFEGFTSFRGNHMAANEFAIIQTLIFSFLLSYFFIFFKNFGSRLKMILFISIFISFFSILLSQSRACIVLSTFLLVIFSFLSIFNSKLKVSFFYNPLYVGVIFLALIYLYTPDSISFLITNVSTLVNYLGLEGLGGAIVNDFESSKRIQALNFIPEIFTSFPLNVLIGFGEGFWNYHKIEELTFFGDSGILITFFMEFGLVSWLIFVFYVINNIYTAINSPLKESNILGIALMFGLAAALVTSFKTSYWYIFLFLGMIVQLNNNYENRHNNNSI